MKIDEKCIRKNLYISLLLGILWSCSSQPSQDTDPADTFDSDISETDESDVPDTEDTDVSDTEDTDFSDAEDSDVSDADDADVFVPSSEWITDIADAPDRVYFRTNIRTFNSRYYAIICDYNVYIKPNVERTGEDGPWVMVETLPALQDQITEIALDDRFLMALNTERRVYQMAGALGEPDEFNWYEFNGFPFCLGDPNYMPDTVIKWDFSVVSPEEDINYTDPAGNLHEVGSATCAHLIVLKEGGRWISFNDSWLPADLNYEVCGPLRGTFRSVALSASGSSIFVMNRYGDMFTTLYDYDISGPNTLMIEYSYYDQRGVEDPIRQLPPEPWTMQPKIPGRITDTISFHKEGVNCLHRFMRVEGWDEDGNTGYWERDIADPSNTWSFFRTDMPIIGVEIDNRPEDTSHLDVGEPEDFLFEWNMDNVSSLDPNPPGWGFDNEHWAGEISDYNCYCSPAELVINVSPTTSFELVLHTTETLRMEEIEGRGLADEMRPRNGNIEVPLDLLDNLEELDPKVRRFIEHFFDSEQHTSVNVEASLHRVTLRGTDWFSPINWEFTR